MIADHVQAVGAAPAERERFRAQSLNDWETILLHRARELRAGGRLVFANFCIDEAGRYLGGTGGANMFDEFARHWRELRAAGRITETEYVDATFQQFYKTPEEFAAPFRDAASPVSQGGTAARAYFDHRDAVPLRGGIRRSSRRRGVRQGLCPDPALLVGNRVRRRARPLPSADERAAILDEFYGAYEADVARANPTAIAWTMSIA